MIITTQTADRFARARVSSNGKIAEPYLRGWLDGRRDRQHVSARHAIEIAPATAPADWAERYLNGHDAGVAGDTTCVAMIIAAAAQRPALAA